MSPRHPSPPATICSHLGAFIVGIPILVAASVLSPLGAWVSQGLGRRALVGLFVAFLLFAAAMMLFYTPRPRPTVPTRRAVGSGVALGTVAGFVGGLLGIEPKRVKAVLGVVLRAVAAKMGWGILP